MGFLDKEMSLEESELKKEQLQNILEIEQKKALIAEAKKRYGKDWQKFIPGISGGVKSGMDWNALKFRIK